MARDVIIQETQQSSETAPARGFFSGLWSVAGIAKILLVVILLLVPLFVKSNYGLNVMTQAGLYAIITLTVGLVLGQAGQLSFGHSAFYGIGAYAAGLLNWKYGIPPFACFLIGGAAGGLVALIVGRPVLKLRYFYLALATMGLGQIFLAVVYEVKQWGAANGFGPVDPLKLFGFEFTGFVRKYYLIWIFCIVVLLFLARLLNNRSGRALRALNVSEIASSTLGVRNPNWKLAAFVFGGAVCGLCGGLFGFVYTAVDPHTFTFSASVLPIVMMLVGGDRWIWGSVVGAIIMTWIMNAFSQSMLQYNGTIWSVAMILLLLFLPVGLLGLRPKFLKRLWAKIKGETLEETPGAADAAAAEAGEEPSRSATKASLASAESVTGTPAGQAEEAVAATRVPLPTEVGELPAPPKWDWLRRVWWLPLLLILAAFFVMNTWGFLDPGGTDAALKATTKALKAVLKGGRFFYAIGIPLIVAFGFTLVRRRFTTMVAAILTLGVGIFSTMLMTSPSSIANIEGEVLAGPGLVAGTAIIWVAFLGSVVAMSLQWGDKRREAAMAAVDPLGMAPILRDASRQKIEGPLLRVENVSVHFGGLKAVSEVSFDVEEGSITALIGPNGAGKTTLFNAVSRLQQMAGGRIFFLDRELTKLDAAAAARVGMARTFQNLRLFVNMSVVDNVLVGCHRHETSSFFGDGLGFPKQRQEEKRSRALAMQALALVGLDKQANLPASSLPYGQQRLVEIARALASQPRLLLLDEPAAGMNQGEREDLIDRIATIRNSGITVLLVEHDMDLVMDISDKVNVLDYGRLIASGTPETVQKDQKVITAYLGAERGERDLCATRGLAESECENLLVVEDLVTSYGSIEALHGVSLTVPKGMVVTVLGANGAGKSTLLHTISGIVRSSHGHISYQGQDITKLAAEKIVSRGLCQVPEGRQLFPSLTVEENLIVGATGRRDRTSLNDDIAYVYDLFPILGERRKQEAGTLSGGEQQMLAIGRALTGKPSLLLLDEPSMGLAPLAVERIFEALAKLNEQGLTMLMVEQNAEMALSLAHLAVVLVTGNVTLSGTAKDLRQDDRVRASYLGGA